MRFYKRLLLLAALMVGCAVLASAQTVTSFDGTTITWTPQGTNQSKSEYLFTGNNLGVPPATCQWNNFFVVGAPPSQTLYWCNLGVPTPIGASTGTVSSVSAGNLSPLFTTSVASPTTTPALSFTLSNAAASSWFGNPNGSPGAPSFNTSAFPPALIPGTTAGSLAITGPNPYYDVTANGMVCDGSTDDTAAFAALLNTINTGTGYGALFFPNTNNPCIVKGFVSTISAITLNPGSPPGTCTTSSSASTYCFEVGFNSTPPAYVKNGAPITIMGTTGCTRTDTVNGEGCNGTYLVVSVSGNNVYVSNPASGMNTAVTPGVGSALVSAYPWTNGIVNVSGQCAPRQNVINCSKISTPSSGELPIYELAMVPCVTAAPLSSTCPAGNATVNAVVQHMNFQGRTTTNNALGGLLVWGINGTFIENNSFQAFVGSGTGCVSNCIPMTPGFPGVGAGITIWGGRIPTSGGSALSNNQNNLFAMDQFSQMTYCITNQGQASGNTLLLEHCIPAGSGVAGGVIANQIGFDFGFTYSQANSNVSTTGGENSFYGVQEELGAGGLFLDNTNEIFVGTFKLEQPNTTPYGAGNHGETLALSVKNSSAVTVYDVQNKTNCTGVHIDANVVNSRISQTNTTGSVPAYCTGTGNLDGGSYTDASNVSDASIATFLNTNGNFWSSPSNQSAGSTFSGSGSYTPVENAYSIAANQAGVAFPVNVGNNVIAATSPGSSNTRISAYTYNAIPFFHGQESGGTPTSPTATAANAFIAEFVGSAYNGSTMNGPTGMRVFTAQNQTGSNGGSNIDFQTIANNTTTPATVMELFQDGGVTIGSPTGGDQGAGTLNMVGCFINGVACGSGGGGGTPGGLTKQYQINNAGSFGGAAALTNSVATGVGTVLITQAGTGGTDIPALRVTGFATTPASDVFQVAAKGQTPGNTCSGTSNCSVWVDASNNWNMLGNNFTLGAGGQGTASFLRLYGDSTPHPAYVSLLNGATGSVTSALFCSITVAGLCGESSSSSPSGDVAAGTALATNPMSAEGDLIYGHTQLGSLSLYTPTRLAIGSNGTLLLSNGTDPTWATLGTAGIMSNALPTTVSGATSGGVACFTSTTSMTSSVLLGTNDIVVGGGAGACPTASADFTIGSIGTHTLGAATGSAVIDFSASTTPMKVPSVASAVTTADSQVIFDSATGAKNLHAFTNSADSIVVTIPISTAVNGDCMKWVVSTNNVQAGDTGSPCGSGGSTALSGISAATAGNTITSANHGGQNWQWNMTSNNQVAWEVGESGASTNGTYTNGIPNQVLGSFYTVAGSTASPLLITNSLSTGQTSCTLCLNPTWNTTSGVVDAGIFMNVTNTSSGTGSKLIDLQVGNTSEFSVDKTGATVAAATVQGTTFLTSAGMQGIAGTTTVKIQSGNDTNTITAPGTMTARGSDITAGSTANSDGGAALLRGGNNAGSVSTAIAGPGGVAAGVANGNVSATQGSLSLLDAFAQAGTVTQYNLECYSSTTTKTVTDCGASPTNIAGVAQNLQGGTIGVTVAGIGSDVPVNLSAGGTVNDTVCAGTTAGKLTDSGGTGPCTTGITVGTIVSVSATPTWKGADGSTATLSTTLALVHLTRLSAAGAGDSSAVACSALPALTGDTTTSAGSCATTTAKVNGGTVPTSAALLSTNGSAQIVAAAASTSPIAVSATGAISITGAAGQVLAGASPAFTATPTLGTDNSVAGTIQFANGGANAHTILGSAATTSNTVKLFATAPTTGDLVDCVTASTTCTLTDSGVLASQVVTSAATLTANQAVNGSGSQGQATGFSPTSSGTITSGHLACYTASNTVGNCTGLPSNNVIGVFNSSSTWIASGETSVTLDGTVNVTFGDILCVSAGSAGTSHDNGTSSCTTGEWVGVVKTTASSVSSATAFVTLR